MKTTQLTAPLYLFNRNRAGSLIVRNEQKFENIPAPPIKKPNPETEPKPEGMGQMEL